MFSVKCSRIMATSKTKRTSFFFKHTFPLSEPTSSLFKRYSTTSKHPFFKRTSSTLSMLTTPVKTHTLFQQQEQQRKQLQQKRHKSLESSFNPSFYHQHCDFKQHLYSLLKDHDGKVPVKRILESLSQMGLWNTDPRLAEVMRELGVTDPSKFPSFGEGLLDQEWFEKVVGCNAPLLRQVFARDMVIPEFERFCSIIGDLFNTCKKVKEGEVAHYIPQLAKACPSSWAVSVCTIDGQRYSVGDAKTPFTMQSASKPLTYAVAVNEHGVEEVHKYVGCEPSGESFNSIKLGPDLRPHNPMINLGAIVTSSMVKSDLEMGDRFDFMQKQYSRMAGGEFVSFNNSVYLSEKSTANRNLALGYYLKEHNCFPAGTNMESTLDLYFMNCSVEITADSGAVIAGTLANGGFCPLTNEQVLSPLAVRSTLVLMHSCGMYDYSGNFSFQVGLPAKSSVSGNILLVVPNVMGLCLWSPLLDSIGNSVKGVHFCKQLVNTFNFHHYDSLTRNDSKIDPRLKKIHPASSRTASLLFAANSGDLKSLRTLALHGIDMGVSDYDHRTALHVAASEGHLECVRFLLERCGVDHLATDRWGRTALEEAITFHRSDVIKYLQSVHERASPS